MFWHITTELEVSSNYIAASVNTDYNEALMVLKCTETGKFYIYFLRLNDVTIHCGSLVFYCSNVHFGVSFLQ